MAKTKFIGVDLHTDNFVVCYYRKGRKDKFDKFSMNQTGLDEFILTLSKDDEIAVESVANVGYFHKKIRRYVKRIVVVSTGKFAVIGKSSKKTDWNDAKALAVFLSKDMLPKARIKSEKSYQLISLIDTRSQLVRMRASLSNKVCAIGVRQGIKIGRNKLRTTTSYQKNIFSHSWNSTSLFELKILNEQAKILKTNIEKLEEEIEALALDMPGYENIISIKGIGPVSAATLLSVIDNIHDFKHPKKLASYFGIVPSIRQSNESLISGRITKAGSKIGRTTLVQCMWVAMKYNPYLKKFFNRIKKRRGGKKAMIACARKFLYIIYDTLKNDWIFDDFEKYEYHVRGSKNVIKFKKRAAPKKKPLKKKGRTKKAA